MKFSILPNTGVPAYRQIAGQITAQILRGALPPGTALPPIRTVAKELDVSVITVRSAWEQLDADGLIETRAGSGCYVAQLPEEDLRRRREELLSAQIDDLIKAALDCGVRGEELIALIRGHGQN